MMDISAFLSKMELFSGLKEDDLRLLASSGTVVSLPQSRVVIRQGEKGSYLWIMLEGTADVLISSGGSEQRKVATLAAGEMFGEASIMTGCDSKATVIAASGCKLIKIPGHVFTEVVKRNLSSMSKLLKITVNRMSRNIRG